MYISPWKRRASPAIVKEELARIGIRIVGLTEVGEDVKGIVAPVQIATNEGDTVVLLSGSDRAAVPDTNWLQSRNADVWVVSEKLLAWDVKTVNTDGWLGVYESATVLEIKKELNGSISGLAERIRALLTERAPGFMARLQSEKVVAIHYEDCYLHSPWNVMLLAAFMQVIPTSDKLDLVSVETVAAPVGNTGGRLWDNWNNDRDMAEVLGHWLSALLKTEPVVKIRDSLAEVSHRRVLTLELESGAQLKLAFDQGMGYWQCATRDYRLKRFDFSVSIEEQVEQMLAAWRGVALVNGGDWPTDIALYES